MTLTEVHDFSRLETALQATSADIEETLETMLPLPDSEDRRVVEAMRHALFAGGKRLRPFLTVATADMFGVSRSSSLRVGAALECIHTYSLIHDDLPAMDDDDLRRGQPTVHKAFDEATAILAGDALLTLAFEILADERCHEDPRVRIALVGAISRASGHHGMVGGQMLDLIAENKSLDQTQVMRLQQMKTGALIVAAVEAGALLGRVSTHSHHALVSYARALGLAFQIADDLLDETASTEDLGKTAGKDAAAGKATLVSLMGADRARKQAGLLIDQGLECLSDFAGKAELLREVALFAIHRRK